MINAVTKCPAKHSLLCLMTVTGLALIGLTGGCSSSGKDKGPTVETPKPLPSNSFARQWANQLELDKGDAVRQLHLRDDTIFVYTQGNRVFAVSRTGGDVKYFAQPNISGGVLRPPVVLGERVIYPSGSTIEVFNNRGRLIRTIELEKPTRSGAVGTGETIYIGMDHTGGTGVMASIAIMKPYRMVNWELMTFGAVTPTPAYLDRTIYAGSEDGRIYAVTEERGATWSLPDGSNTFNTQGRFVADLKVDDFGLYAANTDSKLYCLDRQTGRIKWTYYSGGQSLKTAPVVTATLVYQFVPGDGIVAIDKAAGQYNRAAKWKVKNATEFLSEDERHAYLLRNDRRILAVDKQTGDVVFMSKKQPLEVFAQNLKDGLIYGASKDGKIWAVRPVLVEGEVGTIVMDFRLEAVGPVASAR